MLGRQQHTLFADPTLQQQPLSEEPLTFPPMSAANRKCLHSLAERFGASRLFSSEPNSGRAASC